MGGGILVPSAASGVVRVEAQAGELALAGRVTDAAGMLNAEQVDALDHFLAAFEQRTQHQMVVVTVPALGGRDITRYTRDLANRWAIGRKGEDDGIVVLLALEERGVRIAVGYGLEAVLTDSVCSQVIETHMLPRFREARYYDGLMDGITELARIASIS